MNDFEKVLYYYGFIDLEIVQTKFKIVCPFHEDVNPSMIIDLDKQSYYCFGCDVRGSPLDFVMEIEGIKDKLQGALKLKKIKGKCKGKFIKHRVEIDNVGFELGIEMAQQFYNKSRAIDWFSLNSHYLFKRGFKEITLNKCGARITGSYKYPIVFPMYDNMRFVGTLQRTTNKVIEAKRKYLYNKGFARSQALIGSYFKDWVFVTEGYLDKVKFNQFGIENVVAILGWKIAAKQVIKLRHFTNKIICALDNTPSGEAGYEYLKSLGFEVIRFPFPEYIKDPGEMNKYNFEKAYKILKKEIIKYERMESYGKRKQKHHKFYKRNCEEKWWS